MQRKEKSIYTKYFPRSFASTFRSFKNRTSLVVQWLRIHASTAKGMGLIPGRGKALMQWWAAKTNKQKNINVNMFIHYYGIFFPNMVLILGEGRDDSC